MATRIRPPAVVIGAGRMASALCQWLAADGYPLSAVVGRRRRPAQLLRRRSGAEHAWTWDDFLARLAEPIPAEPSVVLLAIPDDALRSAAAAMAAARRDWRGWCVLHTSGARDADVLRCLRQRGAAVGSMHPMMTFPRTPSGPAAVSPRGIVFSLEGDAAARRCAGRLVQAWGGTALVLTPAAKTAFHLAATLVGPGAVVQMAAAQAVLRRAGLRGRNLARAQAGLLALLDATAQNLHHGPAAAWTGPWARGDAATVAIHERNLSVPSLRRLYAALGEVGIALLPSGGSATENSTPTSKN